MKAWSYLFEKWRASLARDPASAFATGESSRPVVETEVKSTASLMARARPDDLVGYSGSSTSSSGFGSAASAAAMAAWSSAVTGWGWIPAAAMA